MSGRKSNLKQFKTLAAGDMSQASLTSAVSNIEFLDNIGIQLNFTGTPTGTFQVQVSADYNQDNFGNVLNAGNWIPLALSSTPAASGAAGSVYVDLNQLSAPWIRVVYTKVSGTGSLDCWIAGKMV